MNILVKLYQLIKNASKVIHSYSQFIQSFSTKLLSFLNKPTKIMLLIIINTQPSVF